jgi:hypothetical protein
VATVELIDEGEFGALARGGNNGRRIEVGDRLGTVVKKEYTVKASSYKELRRKAPKEDK